ncbi:MAG TPA: ABC transporter ATP-binding protein [Baekduia sp.]|nr:ABC transporter ATP-binding protein [Baekduia sp.]
MAGVMEVAAPASLELRDVCKDYGGLRAVDEVSAVARPGSILGIAGPNGAGKTTLFDVITGLTTASGGEVLLGDTPLTDATVHRRCHAGMARTFQQPTVAGSLTPYENILVAARFGRAGERWTGLGEDAAADAEWILDWSGLADAPDEPAELLGVFDRKRLMIATALAMGPRVLLLDEPFGGLNAQEIDRTLELIRGVAAFGVAVVCIEHVMRALVQLADQVMVMHHGRVFFEGTPQEMMRDQRVIEIYLGEKAARRASS